MIGCKGKDVSKNDIEKLKVLESDLNYPPRLRFQFVCTNQARAHKVAKVKATLIGMSDKMLSNYFDFLYSRLYSTYKEYYHSEKT